LERRNRNWLARPVIRTVSSATAQRSERPRYSRPERL